MSTVRTDRLIDLTELPFPASLRGDKSGYEVEADVPESDLQAAVDAAPTYVEPDPAQAEADFRDAVTAAVVNEPAGSSLRKLADALLGATGPGAEPRRPA